MVVASNSAIAKVKMAKDTIVKIYPNPLQKN